MREFVLDNIDYDLLCEDIDPSSFTQFSYGTIVATDAWKEFVVGLYYNEYTEVDPDEDTAIEYCEILMPNGSLLTTSSANVRKATEMECLKYEFEVFL